MSTDAAYFDRWYADMVDSPGRDTIVARTLGLPPGLLSTSLLSWQGIAEVTEHLRLADGGLLVDLACGRGGYGIEVARRTGACLLGIDFSAVALEQAAASASRLLPVERARFQLGSLTDTGLTDGVAKGLMCVDALQFAQPPLAALLEARRVLAPGGRLVLTTWEVVDAAEQRVPARLRAVDTNRDLHRAGFHEVEVADKPEWRAAERDHWEQAVAARATEDSAMESLAAEGRRVLATFSSVRRVLASATAPPR